MYIFETCAKLKNHFVLYIHTIRTIFNFLQIPDPLGKVRIPAEEDVSFIQGSHRLEKYLKLEGFLEKSLKIKPALKSTGKSL